MYGKGLAINLLQDHLIDYDNSLKGLELNYYLNDYSNMFFLAGEKALFFRSNNALDAPNLAVKNYAYMFGLEHSTDNWGIFHYF